MRSLTLPKQRKATVLDDRSGTSLLMQGLESRLFGGKARPIQGRMYLQSHLTGGRSQFVSIHASFGRRR